MSAAEIIEMSSNDANSKAVNRLTDMGKRFDAVNIDPRTITVEQDFNPRDFSLQVNRDHVNMLKESIKARGVQQPLWVRLDGGKDRKTPVLIDGECRLRAVTELIGEGVDIATVPVVQKSKDTGVNVNDPASRLILALTANDGLPISQMEVGKTYMKLVSYGWDNKKIAEQTGKSERYVREAIAITAAPDAVKELVKSGDVSQSSAIKAVKEQGADAAAAFLQAAAEQNKKEGKTGPVKASKADPKMSKIKLITEVIEDYEALESKEFTKDDLVDFLNRISHILEVENKEVIKAEKKGNIKAAVKSKKKAA